MNDKSSIQRGKHSHLHVNSFVTKRDSWIEVPIISARANNIAVANDQNDAASDFQVTCEVERRITRSLGERPD